MRIIPITAVGGGQPDIQIRPVRRSAATTGTGHRAPRQTRQGLAAAEAPTGSHDFRSAQEIHAALRQRGEGIGLATVYRNLARLVEAGDAGEGR